MTERVPPTRGNLILPVSALVISGLAVLPLVGLWLAYLAPPQLIEPPPIAMERVVALLGRTVALALTVSVGTLLLGSWLAWLDYRYRYRARAAIAVLSVLPLAVPSYLLATIIREQMAPTSILGGLLGTTGQFTGFLPAVLVLTIACTPYVFLLVTATLARCPRSEAEAAQSLGASEWEVFQTVYLPRLRPAWAFGLVLVGLYVVSDFGAVAVLDCRVLTWELYQARDGRDAITLAFGLIAVVVPFLVAVRLLHGAQRADVLSDRFGVNRLDLTGGTRIAAWLTWTFFLGLGILLPFICLVSWTFSGLRHGVNFAPVLGPAIDTVVLSVIAGFVVLVVAVVPSWFAARSAPQRSRFVEGAIYLTSSVPGVLIAVGLLQLILGLKRHAPATIGDTSLWQMMEGAGLFLLLAYLMRFLSQAYAGLKPAMLRLDNTHEEAAKSLGASPWQIFKTISIPAIMPGIAVGYMLVFLSIAKELPITLMLLPLNHSTLAYRIFDAQQEGSLPDVGILGLTLLCIAVVLQLSMNRYRSHG